MYAKLISLFRIPKSTVLNSYRKRHFSDPIQAILNHRAFLSATICQLHQALLDIYQQLQQISSKVTILYILDIKLVL